MRVQEKTLTAATPWRFDVPSNCRYFRVLAATDDVTVQLLRNGQPVAELQDVPAGVGVAWDDGFDGVRITSASGQTIQVAASPYRVEIDRAALTVTLGVGTAITDVSPVNVGVAATALLAQNASRKGARFYNDGANTVYLGGATVTTANAAIRIEPGETWVESDAAGAAWYGIVASGTESVRVQEVQ